MFYVIWNHSQPIYTNEHQGSILPRRIDLNPNLEK